MARRKSGFRSDGSSDSNASDSGENDEARNSQDDEFGPRRKKRKFDRGDGKARAWEGIFGEDDDEPSYSRAGRGGRGGRGGFASTGSSRFKAPAFVAPKQAVRPLDALVEELEEIPVDPEVANPDENDDVDVDMDIDKDSDDADSESDASDASSVERRRLRSPVIREDSDEEDERPVGLGLGRGNGSSAQKAETAAGFAKAGAPVGGLGFASAGDPNRRATGARPPAPARTESSLLHGGIGSKPRADLEQDEQEALYPSDPSHAMPQGFGGVRGIGARGGIGSSSTGPNSRSGTPQPQRQQRSFVIPASTPSASTAPRADVTAKDLKYLESISTSLGARLLAKQGWTAGKGLGVQEDGKAVPIEANIGISRGQGIGKGVRTEQSRREARARGEKFSSDEEEKAKKARKKPGNRGKAGGGGAAASEEEQLGKGENASWKKSKKVRVKVEHKSYEQLLAEAGESGHHAGVGKVLDARSGELKEVASIAALSLSSWTPTTDQTRLPELRHNLRLILEATRSDVLSLAKEGKGVNDRRTWNLAERTRLNSAQDGERANISRLRAVQELVKVLVAKVSIVDGESPDPLSELEVEFSSLLEEYRAEYDEYELDEVIVGAIAQILAQRFRNWQPLEESRNLVDLLLPWKRAYRFSDASPDEQGAESYENYRNGHATTASVIMTPWESVINSMWLPKVRSAINNNWDSTNPQPAVVMMESWWPLLPRFVHDNVLDQLILPKLRDAIRRWSPRARKGRDVFSLAGVIFPWLPLMGPLADELLEEAKLKVGEVLKRWTASEGIPEELPLWREIFSRGKWDTLILLNVLPKLSALLDSSFEVNPRDQQMGPLDTALAWSSLMRDSIFVQLLEERFFPKWLDTLHFWLVQPNYSAGEVATWYNRWKDHLGLSATSTHKKLTDAPGVEHGLRYGLHLMNDAMALGVQAPAKLSPVDYKPYQADKNKRVKSRSRSKPPSSHSNGTGAPDISFRSIAEQHAAQHDLVFAPTGRSHATTGKPLFKVSKSADGRGGLSVYIGDDAVYALGEDGGYKAVLLEDMVRTALRM